MRLHNRVTRKGEAGLRQCPGSPCRVGSTRARSVPPWASSSWTPLLLLLVTVCYAPVEARLKAHSWWASLGPLGGRLGRRGSPRGTLSVERTSCPAQQEAGLTHGSQPRQGEYKSPRPAALSARAGGPASSDRRQLTVVAGASSFNRSNLPARLSTHTHSPPHTHTHTRSRTRWRATPACSSTWPSARAAPAASSWSSSTTPCPR